MMCAIVVLVNYSTTRNLSDLFIYSNTCLKIISLFHFNTKQTCHLFSDHLNYNWGKWNLANGQIHGEDFHKNPQFEITIPDGG